MEKAERIGLGIVLLALMVAIGFLLNEIGEQRAYIGFLHDMITNPNFISASEAQSLK